MVIKLKKYLLAVGLTVAASSLLLLAWIGTNLVVDITYPIDRSTITAPITFMGSVYDKDQGLDYYVLEYWEDINNNWQADCSDFTGSETVANIEVPTSELSVTETTLALYHFNEETLTNSSIVYDASSHHYDGIVNSETDISIASGRFDRGLTSKRPVTYGQNYIDFGDVLNLNHDFIMELWIKVPATWNSENLLTHSQNILEKYSYTSEGQPSGGYQLTLRYTGKLCFSVLISPAYEEKKPLWDRTYSNKDLRDDQWHYVVISFENNNKKVTMWIDGVYDVGKNLIYNIPEISATFKIFFQNSSDSYDSDIFIDELRIQQGKIQNDVTYPTWNLLEKVESFQIKSKENISSYEKGSKTIFQPNKQYLVRSWAVNLNGETSSDSSVVYMSDTGDDNTWTDSEVVSFRIKPGTTPPKPWFK